MSANATKAVIPAEIHSDDHVMKADFDALPWFENATGGEIEDLFGCYWGGDYAADAVAMRLEDSNPEIARVFEYVQLRRKGGDSIGFEVHIDPAAAKNWSTSATRSLGS